jgi:hypothetical protein
MSFRPKPGRGLTISACFAVYFGGFLVARCLRVGLPKVEVRDASWKKQAEPRDQNFSHSDDWCAKAEGQKPAVNPMSEKYTMREDVFLIGGR